MILLAEDDASVQKFAGKVLTTDGFTVLTAGDGKTALEIQGLIRARLICCYQTWICPGWAVWNSGKTSRTSAPESKS